MIMRNDDEGRRIRIRRWNSMMRMGGTEIEDECFTIRKEFFWDEEFISG